MGMRIYTRSAVFRGRRYDIASNVPCIVGAPGVLISLSPIMTEELLEAQQAQVWSAAKDAQRSGRVFETAAYFVDYLSLEGTTPARRAEALAFLVRRLP